MLEPVDEVAAEQRRQVAAGLGHVDPERRHLVAVELHLGLRLVELQVGVAEHRSIAALVRLADEAGSRCPRAGAARRSTRSPRSTGELPAGPAATAASARSPGFRGSAKLGRRLDVDLGHVRFRSDHGLATMPPNPPVEERGAGSTFCARAATCRPRRSGVNRVDWSIVALGAACTMPKITLWSSIGASSFWANMNERHHQEHHDHPRHEHHRPVLERPDQLPA